MITHTWDGLEVAAEPPFGCTVVVHRAGLVLLLHRARAGPDFEGDWAWTAPAGSRQPGESIGHCAERELAEEAGLSGLPIEDLAIGEADWPVYAVEAPESAVVDLVDPEHDRFEWVTPAEALRRVRPERVRASLEAAVRHLRIY